MPDCVTLVVPPWAGLDKPALGAHVLQAVGRDAGHDVRVVYANLAFAARIGEVDYHTVCYAPTGVLVGEQIFAETAFGDPVSFQQTGSAPYRRVSWPDKPTMSETRLREIQQAAAGFVPAFAESLVRDVSPTVVGCSTTFEQTAASLAILGEVRRISPDTKTILGGANCEGEMGSAIARLAPWVDHVFSGESEDRFVEFLQKYRSGNGLPRVLEGRPCEFLDELPPVEFDDYFAALADHLPDAAFVAAGEVWLTYETSRGCWWGAKHHCTFCGLNGTGMQFRRKSPARVIVDVGALTKRYSTPNICMVDNIMPWEYFRELLPRVPEELPDVNIFYEQKSNLTLRHCVLLAAAGVMLIQPGIEALNSDLLRLMRKGVSARQNIGLLRYARAAGVTMNWNLLYGFPGDRAEWYAATAELLPSLEHLCPPGGCYRLSIDRFSPYFDEPETFGLCALEPLPAYADVFPSEADLGSLAYHFVAHYASGSLEEPAAVNRCETIVREWLARWQSMDSAPPTLALQQIDEGVYFLMDTRTTRTGPEMAFLGHDEATAIVGGGPLLHGRLREWALESAYAVVLDDRVVPLATAEPQLFAQLEQEASQRPDVRPRADRAGVL